MIKQCLNNEVFLQVYFFTDCNSKNILTSSVTRRGFGTKQKLSRKHQQDQVTLTWQYERKATSPSTVHHISLESTSADKQKATNIRLRFLRDSGWTTIEDFKFSIQRIFFQEFQCFLLKCANRLKLIQGCLREYNSSNGRCDFFKGFLKLCGCKCICICLALKV